jgi:hypothetical protein
MNLFRATAERCRTGWTVRIDGRGNGTAAFRVRDLTEIEPKARRLIADNSALNPNDVHVEVEVRLPRPTEVHLDLVVELSEEIDEELGAAIAEMVEAGLHQADIVYVLRSLPGRSAPGQGHHDG